MRGYGWSRLEELAPAWRRGLLSLADACAALPRPLRFVTAEFLLDRWPNGGGVIALRTLWCSSILFLAAIGVDAALASAGGGVMSQTLKSSLAEKLSWFGPLFGAVYAALYSRFASQWKHLADTYNLIMREWTQEEGRQVILPELERVPSVALTTWRQAFIYDAFDLHLARKDTYVSILEGLLAEPEIRRGFSAVLLSTPQRRLLAALELTVRADLRQEDPAEPRRRLAPLSTGPAPRVRARRRPTSALAPVGRGPQRGASER